jgi:ribose-phosphate pyrophosphokinase
VRGCCAEREKGIICVIITTNSSSHILKDNKHVPVIFKRFRDGELYVRVQKKVKKVAVIAGFPAPAENLLELIFLLDALRRLKTKVHLLITYFGYARQDTIAEPGESISAKVISQMLKADRITVIDRHGHQTRNNSSVTNVIPIKPFLPFIPKDVVIVAADEGAVARAKLWRKFLKKPIAILKKIRPTKEVVKVLSMQGKVEGRDVLIVDDMISTGGTIIGAASFLRKKGAKRIFVAVTHGIFVKGALQKLQRARISKIFVTNTLPQRKHRLLSVISMNSTIKKLVHKK